jgi:predicted secreted hydrolase
MRSRLACFAALLLLPVAAAQYRNAMPGYRYEFPRDHFNHPDFQTEWWYYTGNVRSADGHRFGFELTFFRQGVDRDLRKTGAWDVRDVYVAHFALSDLDGHTYQHAERINRAGPGLAGINEKQARIWNGNWRIDWQNNEQTLRAVNDEMELNLRLHPEKPQVVNGENGVSQKAEGAGHASHYISLTRLAANGQLKLAGKTFDVNGLAWMDHEFFTRQLATNQIGWDWLSVQLEDKSELMLFRIRRADGSIDPYSAGTFVDAQGKPTHLRVSDFTLQPLGDAWKSPATNATYPIRWNVSVPQSSIQLDVRTPLPSQELVSASKLAPSYWEGAVTLTGHKGTAPVAGVGYLEMTGYDRPFEMGNQ